MYLFLTDHLILFKGKHNSYMTMKKKNNILILLCLFLAFGAGAQEKITKREVLSLDKGWKFHLDEVSNSLIRGHNETYNATKAGRVGGAAGPNYDDSSWRTLDLPHDWAVEGGFNREANLSQGYRDRGIGWYRRKFKLDPEDNGKHLELQFDGIATQATIWVNGTVLHHNFCGYTSMYIDITPYATYGDNVNTVAIRVDADTQEGWWYEGAGMYRHTWLVKRSPVHIITDGVYANPVKVAEKNWEIPVEVTLNNSGKQPATTIVEVTLLDSKGNQVAQEIRTTAIPVLRDAVAKLSLNVVDPQLWSVDTPTLYTVKTVVMQKGVVTDEAITKCGFRTIRFDKDTGFWLNDKNIKIKGVCNHQDHAGVGVAVPDALWEFRLRRLKDMGVNAYRCAHNPNAKEFMDACDSMGMLVMDENRLFNTSPEYANQLEWLIRRDRNRPSVILWSVFNEEPMQGSENGYEMVRRMSDVVKQLDTTRPVTAAMNGGLFSEYNVSQAVDVVGFNYQTGSYDKFHEANPNLPLTSSEDGSSFMVRGEYKSDRSKNILNSYDTEPAGWGATHRNAWKAVAERPFIAGCFYWTGFDYRGEPTPFQWPSVSSFFGIMDVCGFPKMAYFLHQALWIENKDILEVVPHWNWPADSIGKPIKVMTLTNADSVVLKLNGKTISGQKVDKYEMNTWNVAYKPGNLEAVGYKNGKIVSRKKVETTGEAVRLQLTPYRKALANDGSDAMPITVEVVDSKGRPVPTSNIMVEFKISGSAEIIGLGNGDPNSHEPEKGNMRSLFNGLAQVIIQSREGKEAIVLTATAPGMKPATITIATKEVPPIPAVAVEFAPIVLDKWAASPLSKTKPEVNRKIEENDMNSWIQFSLGEQQKLENANFVIVRTTFKAYKSHQKEGGRIEFKRVSGKAEVWLNGKLLGSKTDEKEANFTVSFPAISEQCDIRVLLEGTSGTNIGMKGSVNVLGK